MPACMIYASTFATLLLLSGVVAAAPPAGRLMGVVDGLRSERVDRLDVTGWACSAGDPAPVRVTIYAGEPASGGAALKTVVAGGQSSAAVARACETAGAFGFAAPVTPSQLHAFAGRTIYAVAAGDAARAPLRGPATALPLDAGSIENVAGYTGFDLLIDCSLAGGRNCATGVNPPATNGSGPPAYAYGAAIVTVPGGYRMFYCSVGLQGGWDAIRSSASTDGVHWATPVLKLVTTGATNRDLSACDPSVVFFNGYYYMYYGSAYRSPNGNKQTVIEVARAATIDGPYRALSQSGTWGATAADPPAILVRPAHDVANSYGAGQPAVVVAGGKLWMWYTDDTYAYPHGNILLVRSADPTAWTQPAVTDARTQNVDVKWSPRTRRYVMFSVDPVAGQERVRTRFSKDGTTWSPATALDGMPNDPASFFAQNIGVSGDRSGTLAATSILVTYMAPFVGQLRTKAGQDLSGKRSRPQWNLYGGFAPAP